MDALASTAGRPTIGPYTWDDFVALDEGDRRELIDGQLIEVEVPTQFHEFVVGNIFGELRTWARATKSGVALPSGYKVRITPKRGVMPDVQYFKAENLQPAEQQGAVIGRPDLAVEVISPSSHTIDRVAKFNWYAERGVPEYWLVDAERHVLERFRLEDGHYFVEAFGDGDVFSPDTFPGLDLNLSEIWKWPPFDPPQ